MQLTKLFILNKGRKKTIENKSETQNEVDLIVENCRTQTQIGQTAFEHKTNFKEAVEVGETNEDMDREIDFKDITTIFHLLN